MYRGSMRFSLRSLHSSCSSPIAVLTRWPPRRTFSVITRDNLFDYTSGRWIYNDALRHAERRRIFNIDGLCRLAAQSVNRSPDNVINLEKLAEDGFNRTILVTMCDGFRMVACIPYPMTVPKYFAIASEVATMDLLRSSGLPIPQVYGYSPTPNNAAETEYIFMEFLQGKRLSDIWHQLGEGEIISVLRQLAQLESKMMSIDFPAGGNLYYAEDLAKVTKPGIPLEDARFCIGPDTSLPLWFGRRSQLIIDRGPYESAETALVRAADKELAYLKQFGCPLLPFQRARREVYQYKEQPPADHVKNLERYLRIAPSLIPRNPALSRFCIRHPDHLLDNIIVSESPDSGLHIVGLFDWQQTSILPLFLLTGIPEQIQNYNDPVSESMTLSLPPENSDDMDEAEQNCENQLHRRRLAHYHYVKSTEEHNALHYAALTSPMGVLRHRLFTHAGNPWEGETLALKVALIEATENWEELTGGSVPCPITFDAEDVCETMALDKEQRRVDKIQEIFKGAIGFGPEGWVPTEHYEESVAFCRELKEGTLAMPGPDEERAEIETHWLFDDMDEEKYM